MTTATMFYDRATLVDHAVLNENGLVGNSFYLGVELTGKVDSTENVVIDFSTAKKDIKAMIDDHAGDGFDHKLWIQIGACPIERERAIAITDGPKSDRYLVRHPKATIALPVNCVRFIPRGMSYEQAMSDYLMAGLKLKYPALTGVKVTINKHAYENGYQISQSRDMVGSTFRYTHGLKDSTSFGCQNIGHGHFSFIQIPVTKSKEAASEMAAIMADYMHNKFLINHENVMPSEHVGELRVGYMSGRGHFEMTIPDNPEGQQYLVLPSETTVEHIAAYLANRFKHELRERGIEWFRVSEGLDKGAIGIVPKRGE